MKVGIFGLGYVGVVSAACLAEDGHEVIGVDPNPVKVDLVNRGRTPIIEDRVADLIGRAVKAGRLRATLDAEDAVASSDLSFVCVGTPSLPNGRLDLRHVRRVSEQIGCALGRLSTYHVVVVRSTLLPGTMRSVVIPELEARAGKRATADFGVCYQPEFLREGTAVADYYRPPKTVIGEIDPRSGASAELLVKHLDAPLIRTDIDVAEMVKYADNAWHALKVGFANEIGNVCKAAGLDSHCVMDIFCLDTKLNISPAYLKPGFAFGGSCLPKDLRALIQHARSLDLDLPIINAIPVSNAAQVERGLRMIVDRGRKRVGVLGFSFKNGTDDLRESPVVEVVERLLGKGYELWLYDRNVDLARLVGANRDYIMHHIPHIAKVMVGSVEEVLAQAEVVVVGNRDPEFSGVRERMRSDQVLVDLVRLAAVGEGSAGYDGICW